MLQQDRNEDTRNFWNSKQAQFSNTVGELCLNPQKLVAEDKSVPPQRCVTFLVPEPELAASRMRTGYTNTIFFAAAWSLTLGKIMDADQVFFGLVLSGRDLPIPGAFDVVGSLISTLPLFVQLPFEGGHETVSEQFLGSIRDSILELNDLQHSDTRHGFDRCFNSIMATQFDSGKRTTGSLRSNHYHPDIDTQSGMPLSIVIEEQCKLKISYSTSDYSQEDVNNVLSIFQHGMSWLLQGDDKRLLLPAIRNELMPQLMEQKIRRWSNCGSPESLDSSKGDDLVTLFESVVCRQPNAVAITRGCGLGQEVILYDDFDQAAAVVAQDLGWIKPNEPVCVVADRSVNWLVAIFGVLKAGGVYTPLDPSAPASVRHANFVRAGGCTILYSSSAAAAADTAAYGSCKAMHIDEIISKSKAKGQRGSLMTSCQRRRIARPDDLAYICFTSGSTSEPKAVQCTHKGIVAFQKNRLVRLGATKGTVVAQVMSPVFDGSIHEIFAALTYGATLRLASPNNQDHPFAHFRDCDSAILTPSIASVLDADHYPRLRSVCMLCRYQDRPPR